MPMDCPSMSFSAGCLQGIIFLTLRPESSASLLEQKGKRWHPGRIERDHSCVLTWGWGGGRTGSGSWHRRAWHSSRGRDQCQPGFCVWSQMKREGAGVSQTSVQILVQPCTICVTLNKSSKLTKPQFPNL